MKKLHRYRISNCKISKVSIGRPERELVTDYRHHETHFRQISEATYEPSPAAAYKLLHQNKELTAWSKARTGSPPIPTAELRDKPNSSRVEQRVWLTRTDKEVGMLSL